MSGARDSLFDRGEFVAWDGEGLGAGRHHRYVLFAGSDGTTLTNTRGLATADVLSAFVDGAQHFPRAIHVGFATAYDVNMIVRDVPRRLLKKLWETERVRWRARGGPTFTMEWRPRKYFRVVRESHHGEPRASGTLWDVWPFFQTSFVRALEKYGVATDAMRATIHHMKLKRGRFTVRDLAAITAYNRDEVTHLVTLMERLLASLRAADLRINRWDGPGAIAASILKRYDYRESITAPVSDAAHDAFQHAYYGGRIECVRYGHLDASRGETVYHYDVNSAYPAAMRSVPCRRERCGRWRFTRGKTLHAPDAFAVYHARWSFATSGDASVMHPFPWRSAKASVFFPPFGEGWIWGPEIHAAIAAGVQDGVTILGAWVWERARRCRHGTARAWIETLYLERERAKQRGDGAEHAIKLGLNSLYGKTAQRVGARWRDGVVEPPPYHDLAAAGWITATCRAQLYGAAMQSPRDVIMLATDGIYSTAPLTLPETPGQKILGEWTSEVCRGATVVQSGVYFIDEASGEERIYSRGFDRESLDRAAIRRAWRRRDVMVPASHERFMGMGAALASESRWSLWRTWHREQRDLALHPWGTKRTPETDAAGRVLDASRGLVQTWPTDTRRYWTDPIGGRGMMTTPAPVPWRDGLRDGTADAILDIDATERALAESADARL